MSNDFLGNLREYLTKLHQGEKSSSELSSDLSGWLKDSGESIKEKVEGEIESVALRMGFVQSKDLDVAHERLDRVEREIEELKKLISGLASRSEKVSARKKVSSRIKKAVSE